MNLLNRLLGWVRSPHFFAAVRIERLEIHHYHGPQSQGTIAHPQRGPGASAVNRPRLQIHLGGLERRPIAPPDHRREWQKTIHELNTKRRPGL